METAIGVTDEVMKIFEEKNIEIIRVGLHADESLTGGDSISAGPYHPAFREICEGILFRREIEKNTEHSNNYTVMAAPNAVSKAAGQKKCNIEYFAAKGIGIRIRPDGSLKNREIILKKDE